MVTLNINISSEGKITSSSPPSTNHSQEFVPSPISNSSIESIKAEIPSPEMIGDPMDSKLPSSVPHPEGFESSVSSDVNLVPSPITGIAQNSSGDSKIPTPMDSEEIGSASPKTKPKSRTTKRKSGTK